jgi:hypothetical protein
MSLENEWTKWHLTPRGWERGSFRRDSENEVIVPAPADRVMTCVFKEHQSCFHAKLERTVREEWRCPDQTQVDALLKKFGKYPEQYHPNWATSR